MTEQTDQNKISDAQLWALGVSAVLTEINNNQHNDFYLEEQSEENLELHQRTLKRDWSIETPEELEKTLDWLLNEGHNTKYMNQQNFLRSLSLDAMNRYVNAFKNNEDAYNELTLVINYREVLQDCGILAWDYGRYVSMVRWGGLLSFYPEKRGWELIMPIARRVQETFTDWYHFGTSYYAGRHYWSAIVTEDRALDSMNLIRRLISNEQCVWGKLDWNTDLG